jgi:hypothetical protein
MMKSRSMRWPEHVACIGRTAYTVLVGKPEQKSHQEDLNVGGRIILKWILEKWDGVVWTD